MSVKSVLKLSCPARLGHPALMRSCWGCCRRAAAAEKTEEQFDEERRKALFDEGCRPAPQCPQNASPGGSIWQRSPGGVLRRYTRTPDDFDWSQVSRFGAAGLPPKRD